MGPKWLGQWYLHKMVEYNQQFGPPNISLKFLKFWRLGAPCSRSIISTDFSSAFNYGFDVVLGGQSLGSPAAAGLHKGDEGNSAVIFWKYYPTLHRHGPQFFINVKVFVTKYNFSKAEDISLDWDFNGITLKVSCAVSYIIMLVPFILQSSLTFIIITYKNWRMPSSAREPNLRSWHFAFEWT